MFVKYSKNIKKKHGDEMSEILYTYTSSGSFSPGWPNSTSFISEIPISFFKKENGCVSGLPKTLVPGTILKDFKILDPWFIGNVICIPFSVLSEGIHRVIISNPKFHFHAFRIISPENPNINGRCFAVRCEYAEGKMM